MRQETITTTLYMFSELSDEAKENALNELRDINVSNNFWYECIYDNIKEISSLFGLEITKIYFSGFWSQGDGASFEGSYSYKKDALKNVKNFAPLDTELHKIVSKICDIQKKNFYRLYADCRVSGHYVHSGCMRVSVETQSNGYVNKNTEDDLTQALREFADYIYYDLLQKEYEYLTSDDCLSEYLNDSDYEFTENGKLN